MAWDVEGTKRKILDAATREFVAHGQHGTTIERIARRTRHLAAGRQVLQAEEHALAGTAAHVGGGDSDLGCMSHKAFSSKKTGALPPR